MTPSFKSFITQKLKMKKITLFSLIGVLTLSLFSFVNKSEKSIFETKCFKQKYALVPSGDVFINGDRISVESFYISKTEVTNEEYNRFLQDIRASGKSDLYNSYLPDGKQWEVVCKNKPLSVWYQNQKAYAYYPVVNISYDAALAYCKWLEEKVNSEDKSGHTYEYSLPSREDWVRAAEGKLHAVNYAWGGPKIKNEKGCTLCQYNRSIEERTLFDNVTYTCPANAYYPNTIGLFNMNGNAAEMINERGLAAGGSWASSENEVTNQSVMTYSGPSPFVGFRPIVTVK
jgi:formylglycine-generating enzyme required for sulfatase activity